MGAIRSARFIPPDPPMAVQQEGKMMEDLKHWCEMRNDNSMIIACGKRWEAIASTIGCTVHGYHDDFSASFYTPDLEVIEIGPKFRTALAANEAELAAVKAENERLRGLLKTTLDFAVAYADGTGTLFDEAVAETRAALSEQGLEHD